MNAIDFILQLRRMNKVTTRKYHIFSDTDRPEDVIAEVERWAAEHPGRTRQQKFLEQWPKATTSGNVVCICPNSLGAGINCSQFVDCVECRRVYWSEVLSDECGTDAIHSQKAVPWGLQVGSSCQQDE